METVKPNISGKRIKLAREAAGLEQVDLSAALEVDCNVKMSRSVICRVETQKRLVKDYELDAIAQILDVDLSWLVRGEG